MRVKTLKSKISRILAVMMASKTVLLRPIGPGEPVKAQGLRKVIVLTFAKLVYELIPARALKLVKIHYNSAGHHSHLRVVELSGA